MPDDAIKITISPPPAPAPLRNEPNPHEDLQRLARELRQSHSRRLLLEYLRLRRALR